MVWEPLIETLAGDLVIAHQKAASDEEFETQVNKLLIPIRPEPEFPEIYECPHCKRLAVLSHTSDREITFWYQQEQANTATDSLRSLVEKTIDNLTDGI
ncbi:hypothetical protein BCD64_25205 [Nostoc sp. MBR 210]|nr:hypothetical protein BCD64_25205 [Nostoc sp. MBR 210]